MAKAFYMKPVALMSAAEINKACDRLDKLSSKLTDEFIRAGRGSELASETEKLSDPLAIRFKDISHTRFLLRLEMERRYGPGCPSRLPRGMGPIKTTETGCGTCADTLLNNR